MAVTSHHTRAYMATKTSRMNSRTIPRFKSVVDPATDPHLNGEYLHKNQTWHVEYSPSKAASVHRMLTKHNLQPRSICEVGCGAGEVLRQLQLRMDPQCVFTGFDVAPPAIEMAKTRSNDRLHFELADFGEMDTPYYDLLLILEVVDHVENYLGFLRMLKHRAQHKIFSFSLDISVQSTFRGGVFTQRRKDHSHLHHFNKEIALGTLQHAGYEILDYCYSPNLAFSTGAKLAKPLRKTLFHLSPELSVRLFGGYSLLVLAH
jgi:2-polyprenyl-3-methyl-5-hydroxy-6-metoxy-1,4-benzoquinol methylase